MYPLASRQGKELRVMSPCGQVAHAIVASAFVSQPTSTLALSSAMTSLHSSKQLGDIALKAHIASLCFKCFRCFRGMLQIFYIDVAKVD
jgi:hypothetical protein